MSDLWSRIKGDVQGKMTDDIEDYVSGDTPDPYGVRFGLRQFGNAGQVLGNMLGIPLGGLADLVKDPHVTPMGAVTNALVDRYTPDVPESIKKTVTKAGADLARGVMNSDAVKTTFKWMKDNPDKSRDVEALWDALELLPIGKVDDMVRSVGMDNLPTHIKDFYSPNPQKKLEGLLDAAGDSMTHSVKQSVSPQARANLEAKGTGAGRTKELGDPATHYTDAVGNSVASATMAKQAGREGTLVEVTPSARGETLKSTTWGDTDNVRSGLKADVPEVPDEVVDAAVESMGRLQGVNGKVERGLSQITNMGKGPNPGETVVNFRNVKARQNKLNAELTGQAGNYSPSFAAGIKTGIIDDFRDFKGGNMTTEDWLEYAGMMNIFSRGNWRRFKNQAPKTPNGEPLTRKPILSRYLAGKRRANPTKQQQEAIDFVEARMKETKPNAIVQDNGLIRYRESWASQTKDLGGVSGVYIIDPKKGEVYGMVQDGHDLMGALPPGAKDAWSVTPLQRIASSKADIKKPPATPKGMTAQELGGMEKLEVATGIKPLKGESPLNYERRVMSTWNAPVKARHRAEAGYHGLLWGQGAVEQEVPPDE